MNHLFIINPVAGSGKTLKLVPEIKKAFSCRTGMLSDTLSIEISERPGHATDIARKYTSKNRCRVYAVGGDGTLNEVLNGMVNSGSSLAVIPAGSGNDFSRTIGLTSNSSDLLLRTINGQEKSVDIAKINNRYFINISSIGLDAEVTSTANNLKNTSLFRGSFAYFAAIFATLLKYNSHVLKVTIDGHTFEKESLLMAIANGRFYGGGIQPAPEASINDGFLDICFVNKISILRILKLLPLFMKGKHTRLEEVKFFKGRKIEVSNTREMALNIDGEITIVKQAIYEVIPNGVNLVIPCF